MVDHVPGIDRVKHAARCYYEAWNTANVALLDDAFAPKFVIHDPSSPMPLSMGIDGIVERIRTYRAAIPDLSIATEDVVAEGDRVVTRWILRGTHTGHFREHPPTGNAVEVHGTTIHRVENGRIVEGWTNWDTEAFRRQLGMVE